MTETTTTVTGIAARMRDAQTEPGVWILETGEDFEGGRIVGVYTDRDLAADDFLDLIRDLALRTNLDLNESGEDSESKRLFVHGGCDWISLTRYPVTTRRQLGPTTVPSGRRFEDVDPKELDDEQRRWLPTPIPAELRVSRCTVCGSTQAALPGIDPWESHDQECHTAE